MNWKKNAKSPVVNNTGINNLLNCGRKRGKEEKSQIFR
jgi:hypothetical protein